MKIPSQLGWTSLITAYARAEETLKDERLFADPLALRFVEAAAGLGADTPSALPRLGPARADNGSALWNTWRSYFVARTPFYDEQVLRGVRSGIRQIVIVAAGLDARAYRLDLPEETRVFELDQTEVLDFKESVLEGEPDPQCKRTGLAVDLRGDWEGSLLTAGFAPGKPTVWIIEGLLMYFDQSEVSRLLSGITQMSAPGSRLATEYFSRMSRLDDVAVSDPEDDRAWRLVCGNFKSGPAISPETLLGNHGWSAETDDLVSRLRQYNLPIPETFNPDKNDPLNVWLPSGLLD
ncbi:SAM-dependent methyltransferase [Streptomyces sp. NPDC054775]